MDKTNPLAQLKDIHLPEPISWWPLAPGWYVVLGLILGLILMLSYYFYKRHQANLIKKHALLFLTTYREEYALHANAAKTSADISELLRRVALVYYPRTHVASLHGEAWIEFLQQTSKHIDFNASKDLLLSAPFKNEPQRDLTPLFLTAHHWIKQRKRPCSN